MRYLSMRHLRRWPLAVTTVVSLGLFAACTDSDDTVERDAPGKADLTDRRSEGAACRLLDDATLEPLFDDDVPDPSGTSMGEGFAECEWGAAGGGPMVLVSMLPSADFRSDYVEQLTVTAPVADLGDSAVSFPGLVGIGRGSADGGSVGFTSGDAAAIVAVRSTGDPTKDAAQATLLAKAVEENL